MGKEGLLIVFHIGCVSHGLIDGSKLILESNTVNIFFTIDEKWLPELQITDQFSCHRL